jgi:Fe-S-cluster-containing dehydrogenase component
VQLGFVIDHTRCIGCHACTVACKSENHVPLGDFRTWVKYVEEGEFPSVKRSFGVLRCNQCTDAPCVTICPVNALVKRRDGIVDVDPAACIGCKSCMQGCPYDALYINRSTGTAEKCHFCAHRTEVGLAPACAVVCPTEAIIPGDFHDPQSRVSRMRAEYRLAARKVEAGTGPNVFYREVAAPAIDPGLTSAAGGYMWSDRASGLRVDAETFRALEEKAQARTVYDVPRSMLWGTKITGYLFAKSLAAGLFPVTLGMALVDGGMRADLMPALLGSLAFLALTGLLLVLDLKRPERFYYILVRPNWRSWLARGTFVIAAYGALLTAWLVLVHGFGLENGALLLVLGGAASLAGLATASYTGFLFAQARGRVLWMKRGYWLQLAVQAVLAGTAALALVDAMFGVGHSALVPLFAGALLLHLVFTLLEERMAPRGREKEYGPAARLITHGPLAREHWTFGIGAGIALPLVLMLFAPPAFLPLAAIFALIGLWIEEDLFVRAGQAQPIS